MKKILYLNLKRKWYNMILSGEKTEEYREVKSYWINRFENPFFIEGFKNPKYGEFDIIEFRNGYSKNAPRFHIECKGISIGKTKHGWSDGWAGDVFVIKLGKIISNGKA